MSRIHKKEDVFFRLFGEFSQTTVSAGETFDKFVHEYPDSAELIPQMKQCELACDEQAKAIFEELDRSFVTPFDREDIDALTRTMDDIVDGMEGVSTRFDLFAVERTLPAAYDMADLILEAIRALDVLFEHLPDFKRDPIMTDKAVEVGTIEDRGDVVYRAALGRLFHDESDPMRVIRWKCLLDKMEDTLDSCKDAAVIIQGVVMKNA